MLYLDHAATTPLRPQAAEAMAPYLGDMYGNPSGAHAVSRAAKNAVEEARERVADLIGASHPLEIVFTGGGTESDNLAVQGAALAGGGTRAVAASAVEHEAVLETCDFLSRRGCPVTKVPVDSSGRVDPGDVAAAVAAGTRVVSVMTANNETGIRQPVPEIAAAAREAASGVVVHTDAVQSAISEPVTVANLGADLITLASHKFGGPKGVGLLFVRGGVELEPLVHGGGQELGRRSGTHNVAGIAGMVAALEATEADRDRFREQVGGERDRFEADLVAAVPDVEITGGDRLVQHSHVRIPGIRAETLLVRLDGADIAASAGSACQSGAVETSHVLAAMGMGSDAARECLRFSFGWTTRPGDGAAAAAQLASIVEMLR